MAEHRITLTMDIVGTGDTVAKAKSDAELQYLEMVLSVNDSYGGEVEPLDGNGAPTAAAVLFTRQHIPAHLSAVRSGWARRRALEEFEATTLDVSKLVME